MKPSTTSQFNAIQQRASSDSLVNKLFAGRPNPERTAAASSVRSPNAPMRMPVPQMAPTPQPVQQAQPPQVQPPTPPTPPANMPVKSHTVTNPDGTTVVQTYHKPETGQTDAAQKPSFPDVKQVNDMHHVPFPLGGGKFGFINAKGEIH